MSIKPEKVSPARTLRGVVTVATLVVLAGCATPPTVAHAPEPQSAAIETTPPAPVPAPSGPVTFAAAGDSISAWAPAYANSPAQTWITTANTVATPHVGGFAESGAVLARILEGTTPVDAEVLVIMAGTNDAYADTPIGERLVSLDSIISTSAADNVLIAAVAPLNIAADRGAAWNEVLRQYADDHQYGFFDPWWGMRDGGNYYVSGFSVDGVHPRPDAAAIVGERMQKHITHLYRPNSKLHG